MSNNTKNDINLERDFFKTIYNNDYIIDNLTSFIINIFDLNDEITTVIIKDSLKEIFYDISELLECNDDNSTALASKIGLDKNLVLKTYVNYSKDVFNKNISRLSIYLYDEIKDDFLEKSTTFLGNQKTLINLSYNEFIYLKNKRMVKPIMISLKNFNRFKYLNSVDLDRFLESYFGNLKLNCDSIGCYIF